MVGSDADLFLEVAPWAHPREFDHPAQLHLTPAAPGLGPAQRGDQRLGLRPQFLRAAPGDVTCSASAACDRCRSASELAELGLQPVQRLPERADQVIHGGPAGLQFAGGHVGRVQPALGHLDEPPRAGVERLRGERLEPLVELAAGQLGAVQRGPGPFLGRPDLAGQLGPWRRPAAARVQEAECGTDGQAQQEPGEHRDRVHARHVRSRCRQNR